MFYVYIHTLPNGKIYVGETKSPKARWQSETMYKNNKRLLADIKEFGWENVKHEVVCAFESEVEAKIYEALFIVMLGSEDESIGYNQSAYKKKAERYYAIRQEVTADNFEKSVKGKNILEDSGLPTSACNQLIDQWVFSERSRKLVKDKYINGLSFEDLAKKYKLSVRQVKNIIADGRAAIEPHIL